MARIAGRIGRMKQIGLTDLENTTTRKHLFVGIRTQPFHPFKQSILYASDNHLIFSLEPKTTAEYYT